MFVPLTNCENTSIPSPFETEEVNLNVSISVSNDEVATLSRLKFAECEIEYIVPNVALNVVKEPNNNLIFLFFINLILSPIFWENHYKYIEWFTIKVNYSIYLYVNIMFFID